ncbi:ABC-2 type transport system permease protein [Motilibacter peucedani]|uniref:ABC-2 type transport system permease protein n=1 Tax=Motilibacter peucedani TaxID=598650 RepID=A0A420XP40_9ACTN|nr:ABC transporter permease [Motilibacter peucedani]RKS73958.1 ABC-2 type transport system permease protein [Motilibacter peucedani]
MTALTLEDRAPRTLPRLGGLSPTLVRTELRRQLRNRRVVVFTLVLPVVLFLSVGAPQHASTVAGVPGDAYALVSFAVYGAMVAATSTGAAVSAERAQGWTRQLRLTPLRPGAYVAAKVLSALALSSASAALTLAAGALRGVRMAALDWLAVWAGAELGALVFAALGLSVGYLLTSDNAMQVVGPLLAVLAMLGGLFWPLESMSPSMRELARLLPVYGVSSIARSPLTGQHVGIGLVANVVLWGSVFAWLAARLFRRDTARA